MKKILVAMSGGVDSSVAAALLKRAGFNVAGAFLRCYETPGCPALEDLGVARLAAAKIGIPFYVFDFRKEYKKKVIGYFVSGYKKGLTPNPDIMCNKTVKFGLLFEKAMALGFDYLATGHYARLEEKGGKIKLLKGKDPNKDQSYFLYAVKPEFLKRVIFPVGDKKKAEVRKLAKKFGLPNAQRPDSQGICFVGRVRLGDFLDQYIKPKTGKVRLFLGNGEYKEIGEHQGAHYFTIGQRQGLGLGGGPYFVLGTDVKKNFVTVTKNEKDLCRKEIIISGLSWISGEPKFPLRATVKIRYRHKGGTATIYKMPDAKYRILFQKPQRAIAKGQSAVFYKGSQLLGGGLIV
ncbi:MAG: tRNA 2-thiouridine(34) synthase MnmA [Candidatus Nealsonbacteria bacterium]|nr:tRNA 2-thiouridine(34) synthase MnmA [Candidatus Nealsonbacteria bacterium]